jgi:pimeloyl-ACP methyl ester carboxylesterase
MSVKRLVIPRRNGGFLHAEFYTISEDERDNFPSLVIMCHGGKGDKLEWGRFPKTAEALNKSHFDVLLFDFSGMGENNREPMLISNHIMDLEDAFQWAKKKGYSNISTIGLSLGGLSSLLANLPDRKSAVFWAPVFFLKKIKWFQFKLSKLVFKFKKKPIKLETSGIGPPLLINYQFIEEILGYDVLNALKKFSTPSLIIQGTSDQTIKPKYNREAFDLMPTDKNHNLEMVPGAPHGFTGHHLDRFIELTIEWLKKINL